MICPPFPHCRSNNKIVYSVPLRQQHCCLFRSIAFPTAETDHNLLNADYYWQFKAAAMHPNTFNTMQCISPNALYSPPDCNHCNSLPPNLLHCSQCSVLHSQCSVLHSQCSVLHSTSCPQCIADNVPWLALLASLPVRASTTFLFPPIYCSSLALCCSSTCYTARHCSSCTAPCIVLQ